MQIRRFVYCLKNTPLLLVGAVVAVSGVAGLTVGPASVSALSGSQFNPGRIIDDSVFFNKNAMTPGQIQAFLNSKVPTCDTNGAQPYAGTTRAAYGASKGYPAPYTCLKDYKKTTSNIAPDSGICGGYTGASNESAATIIYKVSQSCGINPQVLLVMLQKEQSLVTDEWPWSIQYQKAMGAFCPDTAPCDSGYAGFFKQMYYGAHRLKVYTANPTSFNYRAGRNNIIYYHPGPCKTRNSSGTCTSYYPITYCGSSSVYIQNQATANLYIYTPYQPNTSALNNLYGTGDSCASYGNRNFWRMFNDWFGPTLSNMLPGGATIQRESSTGRMYLVAENKKYLIPSPDYLKAYKLSGISVQSATTQSLAAYTDSGALTNIIRDNETGRIDMVNDGTRYWVPNPTTCTNWALDCFNSNVVKTLPLYLINRLTDNGNIKPLGRASNGVVYELRNGKKLPIHSPSTMSTLGYTWSDVVSLQSFNLTQPLGPLKITDRAVLKFSSSTSIYYYDGTNYHAIPDMATLRAWGMDARVTKPATSSYDTNGPTNSSNLTIWTQVGTKRYIIDHGKKVLLSSAQQSLWPNTTYQAFSSTEAQKLPEVSMQRFIRITPNIYMIDGNKKRYIPTMDDARLLGMTSSNRISLSNYSTDGIANGAIALGNGRIVKISGSQKIYVVNNNYLLHVASPSMFVDFGFDWSGLISLPMASLTDYDMSKALSDKVRHSSGYSYFNDGKQIFIPSVYYVNEFGLKTGNFQFVSDKVIDHRPKTTITRFLRNYNNGAIYYGSGGAIHYVSSMSSFKLYGGNSSNMMSVPTDFINQFVVGQSI